MTRPPPDPGPFASLIAEMDLRLGGELPAAHDLGPDESGGQLEQTDVGLLVGGAYQRGFSGCLTLVEAAGGRAAIWFDAGRPIDVAPGDASPGARAAATPADIERWFFGAAAWTQGRFQWSSADAASFPHRTHWLRHPACLIHESLQRRGTESFRRWLGTDVNRPRLRRDPAAQVVVQAVLADLDPGLAGAVQLFDGTRAFRDAASGGAQNPEALLRAAFALFCFGAIDFGEDVVDLLKDATGGPLLAPDALADRSRIGALHALAQESDYFTFLGIDRLASRAEVVAAVSRLSRFLRERDLHPDVALATGRERAVIADVLTEAARILADDGLRERYREALGGRRVPAAADPGKFTSPRPGS